MLKWHLIVILQIKPLCSCVKYYFIVIIWWGEDGSLFLHQQTVFSRTTNLREWPSQNWVQFYLRRMLQVIKTNDQNNSVANSLVMALISKLPKESLRFLKYNTHVTIVARLIQLMSCVQHTLAWAYSATAPWMEWQSMSVLSCT